MNGNRSEGGRRRHDDETCPYVFTYGTLRQGARNDLLDFVDGHASLVGHASAPGRLYDLGSYPGVLDPAEVSERVFGELYELEDVGATLGRLDEYEGCRPSGRGPFRRCLRTVRLESGRELEAWIYLYQGRVREAQRIESGDYFRRKG